MRGTTWDLGDKRESEAISAPGAVVKHFFDRWQIGCFAASPRVLLQITHFGATCTGNNQWWLPTIPGIPDFLRGSSDWASATLYTAFLELNFLYFISLYLKYLEGFLFSWLIHVVDKRSIYRCYGILALGCLTWLKGSIYMNPGWWKNCVT